MPSYVQSGLLEPDAGQDFVQAGKETCAIVSSFDQFEYRNEAPLFRRLSENFETCVVGLNLVKQDLEQFQRKYYQHVRQILGESNPERRKLCSKLCGVNRSGMVYIADSPSELEP
jgi:hypothetical protein